MSEKPIYSAGCPCCACTLVALSGYEHGKLYGKPLAPWVWRCIHCGFSLMGLPIPVSAPRRTKQELSHRTCLEVREMTEVWT